MLYDFYLKEKIPIIHGGTCGAIVHATWAVALAQKIYRDYIDSPCQLPAEQTFHAVGLPAAALVSGVLQVFDFVFS